MMESTRTIDPRIQTMAAAGVRIDHLIRQADSWGLPMEDLIPFLTRQLAALLGDKAEIGAICLALGLGSTSPELSYLGRSKGKMLVPVLRMLDCEAISQIERWFSKMEWESLRRRVLLRIGYPASLVASGTACGVGGGDVGAWLDRGYFISEIGLELSSFLSKAKQWELRVGSLVLKDGVGPTELRLSELDSTNHGDGVVLRMRNLSRTRTIRELPFLSRVVALDCPDLLRILGSQEVIVVRNCPRLEELCLPAVAELLHLEGCLSLGELGLLQDDCLSPSVFQVNSLIVDDCQNLILPDTLVVGRNMIVRRINKGFRWPRGLWVGGNLDIRNCPGLELLPPLEVIGHLRVIGNSGIQKLSPGLQVGGDLDLRSCHQLERIPLEVKVGGCLRLPSHLEGGSLQVVWKSAPLFVEEELYGPENLQAALRTVLVIHAFPELAPRASRHQLETESDRILGVLRQWIEVTPRAESEILYAASEAWDDLARTLGETDHPFTTSSWGGKQEDLPVAWLRALLLGS